MLSNRIKHSPSRIFILPLVLLLVGTLLAILTIVLYSIVEVNKDTRISSESYVTAIIEDKLNQQKTLTKDYAYWDDTIKNAYLTQNYKWIEDNIGKYLTDTFKITDLFIINNKGDAILSLKDGQLDKSNFLTINKDDLTALIVKARQSGHDPVPASDIFMIEGLPAIVGACVLTPEDGTVLPSPLPVLLSAKRLTESQLQIISKQYRLNGLHFSLKKPIDKTEAFIELNSLQKKRHGILSWQPDKPGNLMLSKIQLPLLILLISIGCITFVIIRATLNNTQLLKEAYTEMAHLANHDVLTGLANRRLFDELLEQTIHSAKRDNISSAMLYIDLDGFKAINDTHGHHQGDELLINVAKRIKDSIREADTIARIGGDEFTVLLRNAGSRLDIKTTVQKIQQSLEQPINLSNSKVKISASIGIALIPQDGIDPDILLKNADQALYLCKGQGRNTFKFYSSAI